MFEHAWPTTGRHPQVMADAALVTYKRQGRTRTYRVNRPRVDLAWSPAGWG
ncbi:hypothetical protein [Streptomyces sp. AK08-02]|uniref:hypothetical protein n=1 Tax=Streptomyces sp. AK08-02 TaxID=3028654 RepID=UPI0029A5A4C7|nr:hypothetical protein [Streptomyces sp. AK08-02]MDX3752108.1 hypothetical protein [Streptomyces sp. AK08-02]